MDWTQEDKNMVSDPKKEHPANLLKYKLILLYKV